MDELDQSSSKLTTLALRGGLWTFLANLAFCDGSMKRSFDISSRLLYNCIIISHLIL